MQPGPVSSTALSREHRSSSPAARDFRGGPSLCGRLWNIFRATVHGLSNMWQTLHAPPPQSAAFPSPSSQTLPFPSFLLCPFSVFLPNKGEPWNSPRRENAPSLPPETSLFVPFCPNLHHKKAGNPAGKQRVLPGGEEGREGVTRSQQGQSCLYSEGPGDIHMLINHIPIANQRNLFTIFPRTILQIKRLRVCVCVLGGW